MQYHNIFSLFSKGYVAPASLADDAPPAEAEDAAPTAAADGTPADAAPAQSEVSAAEPATEETNAASAGGPVPLPPDEATDAGPASAAQQGEQDGATASSAAPAAPAAEHKPHFDSWDSDFDFDDDEPTAASPAPAQPSATAPAPPPPPPPPPTQNDVWEEEEWDEPAEERWAGGFSACVVCACMCAPSAHPRPFSRAKAGPNFPRALAARRGPRHSSAPPSTARPPTAPGLPVSLRPWRGRDCGGIVHRRDGGRRASAAARRKRRTPRVGRVGRGNHDLPAARSFMFDQFWAARPQERGGAVHDAAPRLRPLRQEGAPPPPPPPIRVACPSRMSESFVRASYPSFVPTRCEIRAAAAAAAAHI